MSSASNEWVEVLESRYGVRREFAGHLAPVLERLAAQDPSPGEWERMLNGVAAAYRSTVPPVRRQGAAAETRLLAQEFVCELRKMDESLKVLSAVIERLQRRSRPEPRPAVVH